MKRLSTFAILISLSLFLSSCASNTNVAESKNTGGGDLTPFKVAISSASAAYLPLWLGVDSGIFKKHGLDVQLLLSGVDSKTALAAGSVQMATTGVADLATPIIAGADLTIIGVHVPWSFFQVYGSKDMKTPADLRGKIIASSGKGTSSDTALTLAMNSVGLVRDRDYKVSYIGSNPARLAALEKGVVDAVIVSPPTSSLLEGKGFVKLIDSISEKVPYGYSAMGVNKTWASKNKETVVNFLRGYAEAVQLGKKDKNAVYAVEKKHLKLDDEKTINDVYEVSALIMPDYPVVEIAVLKATLSLHPDAAVRNVDLSTIYDNSYVEAAKKLDQSG